MQTLSHFSLAYKEVPEGMDVQTFCNTINMDMNDIDAKNAGLHEFELRPEDLQTCKICNENSQIRKCESCKFVKKFLKSMFILLS